MNAGAPFELSEVGDSMEKLKPENPRGPTEVSVYLYFHCLLLALTTVTSVHKHDEFL